MEATTPLPKTTHSYRDTVASTIGPLCKLAIRPLRHMLPLSARKEIVRRIARHTVPGRVFLATQLLDDIVQAEPDSFHRFLWLHHLAYAHSYGLWRFEPEHVEPSRRLLFEDIQLCLRQSGVAPETDVQSVFDAGCSLGFVLRFAETEVFPAATVLRGLDVDRYAIEAGTAYLRGANSKIELSAGDMATLDEVMGQRLYDVVLCCGVLLYFEEHAAVSILRVLLGHTRFVLGLICLAHPTIPNHQLRRAEVRARDGVRMHNLDALIEQAGGAVILHRWKMQGAPEEDNPPYCLLVKPGRTG